MCGELCSAIFARLKEMNEGGEEEEEDEGDDEEKEEDGEDEGESLPVYDSCVVEDPSTPHGVVLGKGDSVASSKETLSPDTIEAWLDDNPAFCHSYFSRKASSTMINLWVEEHMHCFVEQAQELQAQPTELLPGPGDRFQRCGEVSASKLDRPLQPMLTEDPADGSLTFMWKSTKEGQSEAGRRVGGEQREGHARARNSVRESHSLVEEKESLLELVKDIASHLDVLTLCHRILLHINRVLTADRCSLFIVRCDAAHERHLVSRLFDVSLGSTPEQTRNTGLRLPWGKGIVGHVAASGRPLNVANAYKDRRFNVEVDLMTGYKTQSVLCLPLKDYKGEIVGVAQAINKKGDNGGQFTAKDETDFSAYLAFCGIVLHNAKLYEKSLMENKHNQILLELASLVCEEQRSLSQLSFSDVFHKNLEDLRETSETSKREGEIPVNYIYAEFVAWSLTLLNIPDAYCDDRFDPPNEDAMEWKTNSLLCAPICNRKKDTVIGVCQLMNKLEEDTNEVVAFDQNDEQFVVAFALFCGMAIDNTRMFETVSKSVAKQAVTLEVLSYRMMAHDEEIKLLQILPIPSTDTLELLSFDFDGFEMQDEQAMAACLGMLNDLSLLQAFQITHKVAFCWILSVKKNYRHNVPYHNWRHALCTGQSMFALIMTGGFQSWLDPLEILCLMVASLTHDLDHWGVNNSYIQKAAHPLSILYGHSQLEHHHFDQCLMLLNSPGHEILQRLSVEDYHTAIGMIKHAILSTDLAVYHQTCGEFLDLVNSASLDTGNTHHRRLLRGMLMTSCDIAAITKPWPVHKKIAELVVKEFFELGDKEKEEFNTDPIGSVRESAIVCPNPRNQLPSSTHHLWTTALWPSTTYGPQVLWHGPSAGTGHYGPRSCLRTSVRWHQAIQDILNREKKHRIPAHQVNFIDTMGLPLYKALYSLSPACKPLMEGCQKNRRYWQLLDKQQSDPQRNVSE
uniref:cGMP-specific 3',5'-cyclic phosphodiesterase isoform X2 n=1 Tax=Myxine glutinosa TaxID=7769 RepID=UPI00358F5CDF